MNKWTNQWTARKMWHRFYGSFDAAVDMKEAAKKQGIMVYVAACSLGTEVALCMGYNASPNDYPEFQ